MPRRSEFFQSSSTLIKDLLQLFHSSTDNIVLGSCSTFCRSFWDSAPFILYIHSGANDLSFPFPMPACEDEINQIVASALTNGDGVQKCVYNYLSKFLNDDFQQKS